MLPDPTPFVSGRLPTRLPPRPFRSRRSRRIRRTLRRSRSRPAATRRLPTRRMLQPTWYRRTAPRMSRGRPPQPGRQLHSRGPAAAARQLHELVRACRRSADAGADQLPDQQAVAVVAMLHALAQNSTVQDLRHSLTVFNEAFPTWRIMSTQAAREVGQVVVGSSLAVGAGVVAWLLRGGALLASLVSVIAGMVVFDPVPIVGRRRDAARPGRAGCATGRRGTGRGAHSAARCPQSTRPAGLSHAQDCNARRSIHRCADQASRWRCC